MLIRAGAGHTAPGQPPAPREGQPAGLLTLARRSDQHVQESPCAHPALAPTKPGPHQDSPSSSHAAPGGHWPEPGAWQHTAVNKPATTVPARHSHSREGHEAPQEASPRRPWRRVFPGSSGPLTHPCWPHPGDVKRGTKASCQQLESGGRGRVPGHSTHGHSSPCRPCPTFCSVSPHRGDTGRGMLPDVGVFTSGFHHGTPCSSNPPLSSTAQAPGTCLGQLPPSWCHRTSGLEHQHGWGSQILCKLQQTVNI